MCIFRIEVMCQLIIKKNSGRLNVVYTLPLRNNEFGSMITTNLGLIIDHIYYVRCAMDTKFR